MQGMSTLHFTTIGEVIKKYREQAGLTISKLAELSGISKGAISKIERGETERPEFNTIKPIAKVLDMPKQELIEHYVEIHQRPDVLMELLKESVELSNVSLASKVALRFLQSNYEESHTLAEQLYHYVTSLTDTDIQLSLYEVVIKYARQRGMQTFLAKGLLQKYLIERLDLKRLDESFKVGEEILHYADFLSLEEKITFYFRMALHAHNTKRYVECIELCKAGLPLETADTELKARAYLAMVNSYYFLNNFEAVEKHLDIFEKFTYDFVSDATKTTRGIVKAKMKQFDLAIPLLRQCLDEFGKDNKIYVATELLEIYFQTEDMDSIAQLLTREQEFLPVNPQTPYMHILIGLYYQFKGNFLTRIGHFDDGMSSYITSLRCYGNVYALEEITKCMEDIFSSFANHSRPIDLPFVTMMYEVYNSIVGKKRK